MCYVTELHVNTHFIQTFHHGTLQEIHLKNKSCSYSQRYWDIQEQTSNQCLLDFSFMNRHAIHWRIHENKALGEQSSSSLLCTTMEGVVSPDCPCQYRPDFAIPSFWTAATVLYFLLYEGMSQCMVYTDSLGRVKH